MVSFPPASWDIRQLTDMDAIDCNTHPDKGSLQPLLAVAPADGQEGAFRFALAGERPVNLHFPVRRLLPHPQFKEWFFDMQLELGTQVSFGRNSTCTRYKNTLSLLSLLPKALNN